MRCLVTAGPTYEPLDSVRRLTNFSTGRLGSDLARYLFERGHHTRLLVGEHATYRGEQKASEIQKFGTTAELREFLAALAGKGIDAVFHAAAVSDFGFGKVYSRATAGELLPVESGKFSTRQGALFAELVPTPKIISELRQFFPQAVLVGWKYEVDGTRVDALQLGRRQIEENKTTACVVNGPAYGLGFGLVTGSHPEAHFRDPQALYEALAGLLTRT